MSIPIDFDDQLRRKPGKVGNIRTDGRFAPESCSEGSEVAEHVPHFPFGQRQFPAQGPSALASDGFDV
jgi:hypothetical protein